jgi:hypothetical protein
MTTENADGKEASMGGIVARNVDMLDSHLEYNDESVGVNAGIETIDGITYSFFAINGFIDPATGAVRGYGNRQELPDDVKNGATPFVLHFGMPQSGGHCRLFDYGEDQRRNDKGQVELIRLNALEHAALEKTVTEWSRGQAERAEKRRAAEQEQAARRTRGMMEGFLDAIKNVFRRKS